MTPEPYEPQAEDDRPYPHLSQTTVVSALTLGVAGVLTGAVLILAARNARLSGEAGGPTLLGMLFVGSITPLLGPLIWYGKQGRWRRLAVVGGNTAGVIFFLGSLLVFA